MIAEIQQEIPLEYQDFKDVFTEKVGNTALLEHQPWDHEIPLLTQPSKRHKGWLKQLSQTEEDILRKYINKHMAKQFI